MKMCIKCLMKSHRCNQRIYFIWVQFYSTKKGNFGRCKTYMTNVPTFPGVIRPLSSASWIILYATLHAKSFIQMQKSKTRFLRKYNIF